mgnify:CR=1 FL=1
MHIFTVSKNGKRLENQEKIITVYIYFTFHFL